MAERGRRASLHAGVGAGLSSWQRRRRAVPRRSTRHASVAARLLLSLEGTTTPFMFRTCTPCAAVITVTAGR
eukprot:scaffold32922_cov61-Phaeocystis_antarctica.AAC.2